jgi:hypothetical protein
MNLWALRVGSIVAAVAMMASVPVWGQGPGSADAQQRVAALKEAVAANKQQLQQYQWLETTDVSVKGQTKKETQAMARYGPDGKVVKTPTQPAAPPQQQRGLKGRIVEKKVDEMKDYTERVKSLISHYVPPEPDMIQAAQQAGHASVNPGAGFVTIVFTDYYKPGDKLTIGFDPQAKKLRSYDVATYLDDPVKDVVTMTTQFASLPDGTNHVQQTVLDMAGKQMKITNTNSGYSKVN